MNRAPRHPDLPILDDLRSQLRAKIVADQVATHGRRRRGAPVPAPAVPERRRRTRGALGRVTRRSVVIVALLCLIAGGALAAGLSLRGGSGPLDTEPQELGTQDGAQVFGYRNDGHLCIRVETARRGAGYCGAAPTDASLNASSERMAGARYVVGYAAPRVRRVAVKVGDRRVVVAAHRPQDPEAAGDAGVPDRLRWFVADLGTATRAPAHLVALDANGHRVGPTLLDCSLAILDETCRRTYESRAVQRLHRAATTL